jgi:hypothetical protein
VPDPAIANLVFSPLLRGGNRFSKAQQGCRDSVDTPKLAIYLPLVPWQQRKVGSGEVRPPGAVDMGSLFATAGCWRNGHLHAMTLTQIGS